MRGKFIRLLLSKAMRTHYLNYMWTNNDSFPKGPLWVRKNPDMSELKYSSTGELHRWQFVHAVGYVTNTLYVLHLIGPVIWRLRCGRLSNGTGQCGSQDEPSYFKQWPKVPWPHSHSRCSLFYAIKYGCHCLHSSYVILSFICSCRWLGRHIYVFLCGHQRQNGSDC